MVVKDKEEDVIEKVALINPFETEEDDYQWLELDSIPNILYNPLENYQIGGSVDPIEQLLNIFLDSNYLHFAARLILNVELPPYQAVNLDVLWNKRLPMLIGSRGAAKSFLLGVYCLLRMVLHPGCRIVIVGSGLRQARQVFDYMHSIWDRAPVLRDIAGKSKSAGPRREVDRFQFEIGDSVCVALPLGDGVKIRGQRANYIIADEFASIPEDIFNLVVQGFAVVSSDPIAKIKEAATIRSLKRMGQWTSEMQQLKDDKGGGNQIIYSGTAYFAFNHFYKRFQQWHDIIASKGDPHTLKQILGGNDQALKGFRWQDYAIIRLPYTAVPEGMLDEGILAQGRATLSRSQFLMEFCAVFAKDTDGFYRRSILESATTNRPIQVASGDLIQFAPVRSGDTKKMHVIGIDPAADRDNAAIVVLELNMDHRKIVYSWTTNKKKYNDLRKYYESKGEDMGEDYYRHIAKKVRSIMRNFNTERIVMDKNGGGTAIAEALISSETYDTDETPIYEILDPKEPKPNDIKKGLHILELLKPTQELNAEANHGMLKDFQDKVLLFPMFNSIELAKAIIIDRENEIQFDTYEDLVQEVEELKTEITTVVVTPSSILGKETFDTPAIKGIGQQKGRLRKDRYSALLYANFYARNRNIDKAIKLEYQAYGRKRDDDGLITTKTVKANRDGSGSMYYGPGLLRVAQNQGQDWVKNGLSKLGAVKHNANFNNPNNGMY